jgi:UDP-glucose 4-epimerase
MKILITWWLWYIASHVVTLCLEHDIQPVLLDNCANADPAVHMTLCEMLGYQIPWYRGDIVKPDLIRQICREHEIAGVMHFAAFKAVGDSCADPFAYYANNVRGTIRMCEELNKHWVRTILFSSSCTVYGMWPWVEPPFDESLVRSTTNPYGTTKFMNELMFQDLARHQDWRVMLLRYFNPIWAHPSWLIGENPAWVPTNLLPYIMRVATGQYPSLSIRWDDYDTPDGTAIRDYIHVMDLASAHILALKHLMNQSVWHCDAINLWTGVGTSVMETVKICESVVWHPIPYQICPRRDGDVQAAYADPSKAKRVLWRVAQHTVAQAVADGWRFSSKHKAQITNHK